MSEAERSGKSGRAKRWTADEARAVIEQWRSSGQTAAAFSAQRRISATRLAYWSKQLEQADSTPPAQFVAVTVPSAAGLIEIEVGQVTLRVRADVDTRYVVQLVAALQAGGVHRC